MTQIFSSSRVSMLFFLKTLYNKRTVPLLSHIATLSKKFESLLFITGTKIQNIFQSSKHFIKKVRTAEAIRSLSNSSLWDPSAYYDSHVNDNIRAQTEYTVKPGTRILSIDAIIRQSMLQLMKFIYCNLKRIGVTFLTRTGLPFIRPGIQRFMVLQTRKASLPRSGSGDLATLKLVSEPSVSTMNEIMTVPSTPLLSADSG